ncbi:MAG: hypothetical protein LBD27_08080 [Tannerella sp.]|nr:hypothetical protein [Tannerella sp.]
MKVSTYNWQRDKSGLSYYNTAGADIAALKRAEDAGIYAMPVLPLKDLEAGVTIAEQSAPSPNARIAYDVDYVDETAEYLLIKGWAYTEETSMDFTDIFLWLRTDNENIKIDPFAERRYEVPVNKTAQENCGFLAVVPKSKLPKGTYRLGVEIQKRYIVPVKKSAKYADTDKEITIN